MSCLDDAKIAESMRRLFDSIFKVMDVLEYSDRFRKSRRFQRKYEWILYLPYHSSWRKVSPEELFAMVQQKDALYALGRKKIRHCPLAKEALKLCIKYDREIVRPHLADMIPQLITEEQDIQHKLELNQRFLKGTGAHARSCLEQILNELDKADMSYNLDRIDDVFGTAEMLFKRHSEILRTTC